jgi:hypothetical protein
MTVPWTRRQTNPRGKGCFIYRIRQLTFIPPRDNIWLQKSKDFPTPRKVADCGGLPTLQELWLAGWV